MPQKKVFGRRAALQTNTFASMLNSSPDVIKGPQASVVEIMEDAHAENDSLRRSPRIQKSRVLQPVSGNAIVSPRAKLTTVLAKHQKSRAVRSNCDQAFESEQQIKAVIDNSKTTVTDTKCSQDVASLDTIIVKSSSTKQSRKTTKTESDVHPRHDDLIYEQHCRPLLDISSSHIEPFANWATRLAEHLDVTKIAEASYGEVYRLTMRPTSDLEDSMIHHESVLKIIPLKPPQALLPTTKRERSKVLKKISMMSKPEDVSSEVRLLQRMSMIPGFTDFREMTVLQGRPPKVFVKAYQAYNKAQKDAGKEPSTYADPSKKTSYQDDQLWAVIEMRDAGTDLERLVDQGLCKDIWSVWDIFWQVALALAKGEDAAQFEHRDLHLGNICVHRRDRKRKETGSSKKLHYTDLDITLIDYTVSRATMNDNEEIAYIDLAKDEWLFTADSTYDYQYDIYRYMRSALFHDDPLAEFDSTRSTRLWSQHHPQTNLVWLHFLLYTLLEQMQDEPPPSKVSKPGRQQTARWKHNKKLKKIMMKVNDLLDPENMVKNGIVSASILIAIALENAWLDEQDVIGDDESGLVDSLIAGIEDLHA